MDGLLDKVLKGRTTELVNKMLQKVGIETFKDDKKMTPLDYLVLFFVVLYLLFAVFLWIRLVVVAFSCSTPQGFAAIFFTSFWTMYKFTNLVSKYCSEKNSKSSWFS